MTCYRDKTFCEGDGCAKFEQCHRALKPEVWKRAEEIGLPIARFEHPKKMPCYQEPTKGTK